MIVVMPNFKVIWIKDNGNRYKPNKNQNLFDESKLRTKLLEHIDIRNYQS